MNAKDVMSTPVITVEPQTPVQEIARLLLERRISAVPVVGTDERVVGVVSEGDLMRRSEADTARPRAWWLALVADAEEDAHAYVRSHGLFAQDVMTREAITVNEDTSLEEIASLLERKRIKRVPVLRDGRLVGIVSRANLLQGLAVAGVALPPSADDATLRSKLLGELARSGADTWLLNVVVSNGVAHLWGAAQSEAERQAVRVAAERIVGAARVKDHLSVLSANVRGAMWGA